MDEIRFSINEQITVGTFINLLERSTLAERRPVDDSKIIEGMLQNTNLLITAWKDTLLVGVSRSVTDFNFCCYLSDLAVDQAYQKLGIGKKLVQITHQQLGPRCSLILLSAPGAVNYYPRIGFSQHPSAWVLRPGQEIT